MRQVLTLPSIVTSGSLSAGFLALLAIQTSLLLAAYLVVLAAVLGSLDGMVVHRSPTSDPFAANLDSLADLISFGVVPALALYEGSLHTLPILGLAACVGFLLCGAWHLARFRLATNPRRIVGLPLPPAGVAVMLLVALGPPQVWVLLIASLLAGLMISEMPFPKLSPIRCVRTLFNK